LDYIPIALNDDSEIADITANPLNGEVFIMPELLIAEQSHGQAILGQNRPNLSQIIPLFLIIFLNKAKSCSKFSPWSARRSSQQQKLPWMQVTILPA